MDFACFKVVIRLPLWVSAEQGHQHFPVLAKLLLDLHDLFLPLCSDVILHWYVLGILKIRGPSFLHWSSHCCSCMLSVFLPIQQKRFVPLHLGTILFLTGLSCWRLSMILFLFLSIRSSQSSTKDNFCSLCTEFC